MLITHDARLASRRVCLALAATAGLLVLTSCSSLLDDSGFKVINDTGKSVWLIECSQDRPDFPGPTVIKPGGTLEMQGDWLPADDPGAACYIASSPGSSRTLFSGCLEMPTDDNDRTTYKVSEARSGSDRKTCMDLSSPGPP